MASCHEMKKGEVYICRECGLELEVVKECTDAGREPLGCSCDERASACTFSCCGSELVKKE